MKGIKKELYFQIVKLVALLMVVMLAMIFRMNSLNTMVHPHAKCLVSNIHRITIIPIMKIFTKMTSWIVSIKTL